MKNLLLTISLLLLYIYSSAQGFLTLTDTINDVRPFDVSASDCTASELSNNDLVFTYTDVNQAESAVYNLSSDGKSVNLVKYEDRSYKHIHTFEDGGYIGLASIDFPNNISSQIYAARYNADHSLQWENTYTEVAVNRFTNLIQGAYLLEDGFLVYGSRNKDQTNNTNSEVIQAYMVKIDWEGVVEWNIALEDPFPFVSNARYDLIFSDNLNVAQFQRLDSLEQTELTFIAGHKKVIVSLDGTILESSINIEYDDVDASDFSDNSVLYVTDNKIEKIVVDGFEIILSSVYVQKESYSGSIIFFDKYSFITKFNSDTRERLWTKEVEYIGRNGFYGRSSIELMSNGNILYVPATSKNIHSLDFNSGEIIKSAPLNAIGAIGFSLEGLNVFKRDGFYMYAGFGGPYLKKKIVFFKFDSDLNIYDIEETSLLNGETITLRTIRQISNNQYIGIGALRKRENVYEIFTFKANGDGVIFSNEINGSISGNIDYTCQLDSNNTRLGNWGIIANKGEQTFYSTTDDNGDYQMQVDTGNFKLSIVPKNDYWLNCDTTNIEFTTFFDTLSNIDLITSAITPCSFIEVDVGFGFLRRCFSNRVVVQYCNQGTIGEEEAMVELHLDPFLDVDTTSIPITSQIDTTLIFDIGAVGIAECGTFTIHVTPNCDNTILGQEHCINAHVFPDTLCVPQDSLWSGANVVVEAICLGDSVLFNIINDGLAPTKNNLVYLIIVDDIIVSRTDEFSLAAGESIQFVEYEPGSTITLIADQEPFHPLGNQVGAEAFCAGTDFDFISSFNQFDNDPFTDIVCVENMGSFDPNDKAAIPTGLGPEHYIPAAQELEYKIRFQNTGTDTAFTVEIRDTVSSLLDMTTLEAGIGSHDYILDIEEENILVFTFNGILLPDSTVNWTASNGFVEFKISPVSNVVPDDVIENTAAIFFDFNEPVITNTVFHTIETPVVFSITNVDLCANEVYNAVYYDTDTMISVLFATPMLDSFAITELHLLPVDSIEEFVTVPSGTLVNNELLTTDTTIYESYTNTSGCDSILIRNFMIENTNSVSLVDKAHWEIFPNPTKDILSIRTNQALSENIDYTVKLYSIIGKTVYEAKHGIMPNKNLDLTLGELAAGTYILTISSKHGMISEKVVINP